MRLIIPTLFGVYMGLTCFVMVDYIYTMIYPKPRIIIKVERPIYGMPPMQYFWMDPIDKQSDRDI